jgi:hypothetical protein
MQFYSYLWLREDSSPYYAGKGHGNRAYVRGTHRYVYPPKNISRILVFPMANEAEAFESEVALIELFGRKDLGTGCLLNQTSGGEGCPSHRYTPELKLKLQAAARKPRSPLTVAHKAKLRVARAGTSLSVEHRSKISTSLVGNQRARGKHWKWHEND